MAEQYSKWLSSEPQYDDYQSYNEYMDAKTHWILIKPEKPNEEIVDVPTIEGWLEQTRMARKGDVRGTYWLLTAYHLDQVFLNTLEKVFMKWESIGWYSGKVIDYKKRTLYQAVIRTNKRTSLREVQDVCGACHYRKINQNQVDEWLNLKAKDGRIRVLGKRKGQGYRSDVYDE